jgi:hypothetical protein
VKVCTEVLALDPDNVKVLFRRAQAYHHRKDYDEALDDLKLIVEKEGKTTAVVGKLLKEVRAEVAKERSAQAKLFGGMFNKISLVSESEIAEAKKAAEKKPPVDSSDDDEPPAMDESPDRPAPKTEEVQQTAAATHAVTAEAPKEETKAAAVKPDEGAAGGDEDMTPEQAAAMAAMNDELFGICEEGQAGLSGSDTKADATPAKVQPAEPAVEVTTPAQEPEPQVTVHVPAAEAPKTDAKKGKKPAAEAKSAEKKPAAGKGKPAPKKKG